MTPRSPTRMLARHCDRYVVTLASPVTDLECPIRKPVVSCAALTNRCAPQQGLHIGTWVAGARLFAPDLALSRLPMRSPSAGAPRDQRAPEEHRDLR